MSNLISKYMKPVFVLLQYHSDARYYGLPPLENVFVFHRHIPLFTHILCCGQTRLLECANMFAWRRRLVHNTRSLYPASERYCICACVLTCLCAWICLIIALLHFFCYIVCTFKQMYFSPISYCCVVTQFLCFVYSFWQCKSWHHTLTPWLVLRVCTNSLAMKKIHQLEH